MDLLDFAIYRFLSPDGEARFWGGRRLINPTMPAGDIATHVGISENGVRARLRGLAAKGFLRGTTVIPNPSLFGTQLFVAEIPVRDVSEVDRALRDLSLVDGVIFARDTLDEGDRHIRVHFVSDSDGTTARRATLLRRLAPTNQIRGPQRYWIPVCDRELSPLDWRMLHAVWSHPDSKIAETAHALRISPKTAAQRYHRLIESRACWWTHGPDSEEFPLALLLIEVRDVSHRDDVAEKVRGGAVAWMPVAGDGLGFEPGSSLTWIAGLVPADAPVVLERLVRRCTGISGVTKVHRTFPLGSATYPQWFADRIGEQISARP
ncbi:MAG: Lrp/AsnC family transcriptional regulator [Thermoplasmata archaeon]